MVLTPLLTESGGALFVDTNYASRQDTDPTHPSVVHNHRGCQKCRTVRGVYGGLGIPKEWSEK